MVNGDDVFTRCHALPDKARAPRTNGAWRKYLKGFLYRVSPVDPAAFVAALAIVVLAVLVAAVRPAGRAARVDPMASMRTET